MKPYSPTSRASDGAQTAYTAGLSYFADNSYAAEPMGNIVNDALSLVPGGSTASGVAKLVGGLFGGSAVDRQREDRANYFGNRALSGNVAAAQIVLAGPNKVSGNERPYWENALNALQSSEVGSQALAEAQRLGPYWNTSDTATNYPNMIAFADAWDRQHAPISSAVSSVTGAVSSALNNVFGSPAPAAPNVPGARGAAGISPLVLAGGALAVGFLLFGGRKGRR